MRRQLLVATGNPGKAREFGEIFAGVELGVAGLGELGVEVAEPEETGKSFLANAVIKAMHYAKWWGGGLEWVLADDSGLEVDALGGAPGVYSADWAGRHGVEHEHGRRESRDAANNALLLSQLDRVPAGKRTARFVCQLVLADARGRVLATARGEVEGEILFQARGSGGFGYDPLFLAREVGRTTAEMSAGEKHAISHRGRASAKLVEVVRGLG
jgi:XTP/dITP diphosphohydrolase